MTETPSRDRREPVARARPATTPESPCPCGRGETYGECCAPFHQGLAAAPTAERLMRSRYSAFVVGDESYLLATWHPTTRPRSLELDARRRWLGLDILAVERGGLLDVAGVVEFVAHSVDDALPGARREIQTERSRFVRDDGRWSYVDGAVAG